MTDIEGGDYLKRGGDWTVCRFKDGGGLGKKDPLVVFLRGRVDSPMHTMRKVLLENFRVFHIS